MALRHDIFISYATGEATPACETLCAHLEAAGLKCWMAPRDIRASVSWDEAILDAIEGCAMLVVLCDPKADQSGYVKREVALANECGKTVLPVRLVDFPMRGLRFLLLMHHWFDATRDGFEAHLPRLTAEIYHLLGRPNPAAPEVPAAAQANREQRRWSVDLAVHLGPEDASLSDITPAGARLQLAAGRRLAPGGTVTVEIAGFGQLPALVLRSDQDSAGVRFLHEAGGEERLRDWLAKAAPPRPQPRHKCSFPAVIAKEGEELDCTVTDLSRYGAAVEVPSTDGLALKTEVTLILPEFELLTASVRHIKDKRVGLYIADGYQGDLPPEY